MTIKVKLPLFGMSVWFLYDMTNVEIDNWLHKRKFYINNSDCVAWCGRQDSDIIICYKVDPRIHFGVVAHEVAHASVEVYKYIGARITDDSDEFNSYIIQYLIDQFYNKVKIND